MGLKSYPMIYFELMFTSLTLIMGMSLSSAFLPIFANELDPSGVLVGFVVSAWFFSRIFTELPSGVLADRFGRRKLLMGGLVISAVGAFICSIADFIYPLIIGRAIWGLGTALFFMGNTALILELFKSTMRGRALGVFQGIEFTGSFIGAPIGAFMAEIIGYKRVFSLAFMLILCSFSVAFISKGLRQMGNKKIEGQSLSLKKTFSSLRSLSLIAICINSLSRSLIAMGAISTILPLYLNHQLGISVELIGVVMSLRTAGIIVATMTSGYLSDIFGRKPMIMLGILMEICSLYLYTLPSSFEMFLPVGFLGGFGGGMTLTSLIVLLSEAVPAKFRGGAIGMYRTFMDIGGFIGPPLFMILFSSLGTYVTFLSAIAILALNIALMMKAKGRRIEE